MLNFIGNLSFAWRCTEEVVPGRTRNAFVEQSARGFESHRLRQMAKTALLFLFTRKREFWNPFVCFRHNRAKRKCIRILRDSVFKV